MVCKSYVLFRGITIFDDKSNLHFYTFRVLNILFLQIFQMMTMMTTMVYWTMKTWTMMEMAYLMAKMKTIPITTTSSNRVDLRMCAEFDMDCLAE